MQRSYGPSSDAESNPVYCRYVFLVSATRRRPSGVIGGRWPSGGSTTSEDCRDGSPRSSQNGGGDVWPPTSPIATTSALTLSTLNDSLSRSDCFSASFCRCLNSSSVRYRRLPNCAGRSNGTPTMAVLGQIPCKSGSPHAVRGGVYVFSALCAPSDAATHATTSTAPDHTGILRDGIAASTDHRPPAAGH